MDLIRLFPLEILALPSLAKLLCNTADPRVYDVSHSLSADVRSSSVRFRWKRDGIHLKSFLNVIQLFSCLSSYCICFGSSVLMPGRPLSFKTVDLSSYSDSECRPSRLGLLLDPARGTLSGQELTGHGAGRSAPVFITSTLQI